MSMEDAHCRSSPAFVVVICALFTCVSISAGAALDCDKVNVSGMGPYGDGAQFTGADEESHPIFVYHPPLNASADPFPVIVFSHGSTGEAAMYAYAIRRYVSHGFVVVFPHIKDPDYDTHAWAVDPHGHFTIRGVHYVQATNRNASSALYKRLDLDNLVLVGHSMGASATILASVALPPGTTKLAYAQHPGICGPFGPPPCIPGSCNTWMPADFENISARMPVVLSTATNDAAFWPAPHTAEHEFGCFNKSTIGKSTSASTVFAQFSADACQDDGKGGRPGRSWSDGGHDCPMKQHSVETPWVIVAAKLYAQLGGDPSSKCHAMFWGSGKDSLQSDPTMEHAVVNPPSSHAIVV